MTQKITISHPGTLKGFAAAYAAWYGLYVCVAPDKERPEVEFSIQPPPDCGGPLEHKRHLAVLLDGEITPYAVEGSSVWDHLVPDFPIPEVIRYVEDDEHRLPNSREIRAFIATLPRNAEGLAEWIDFDRFQAFVAGLAILRFAKLPLSEQAEYLYEKATPEDDQVYVYREGDQVSACQADCEVCREARERGL